jgi:hypothetical protein
MSMLNRNTPCSRSRSSADKWLRVLTLAVALQGWCSDARAVDASTPPAHDPKLLGFTPLPGISPWPINPDDPQSSVPGPEELTKNPLGFGYLLQDLSVEADKALGAKNYGRAEKFYLALAKAVPTRATAFSKLCATYEAAGRLDEALETCRVAAALEGVQVADYVRLVQLTLRANDRLAPKDVEELDAIFAHLSQHEVDAVAIARLQCDVGARLKDEQRLERCVAELLKVAPSDAATVTYQWSLATLRGDWNEASQLVERAKQLELPPAAVHSMEQGMAAMKAQRGSAREQFAVVAGGALAVGALAVAIARLLRRRRVSADATAAGA